MAGQRCCTSLVYQVIDMYQPVTVCADSGHNVVTRMYSASQCRSREIRHLTIPTSRPGTCIVRFPSVFDHGFFQVKGVHNILPSNHVHGQDGLMLRCPVVRPALLIVGLPVDRR